MKRLFWFTVGVVVGIYGTLWVRNTASDLSQRLSPSAILEQVLEVLRQGWVRLQAAVSGAADRDDATHPSA